MNAYYHFLNRSNSGEGFRELLNGKLFVDKTMLIREMNEKLSTKEKWVCVSRARRFGKTMALEMLAAYYTKGIYPAHLFEGLKIEKDPTFSRHLNKHNVILINFNEYFNKTASVEEGIERLSQFLIQDLKNAYPGVIDKETDAALCLDMVCQIKSEKFIFLIDEWDSIFRERRGETQEQERFLDFLRTLFKDKSYVELVYITGILPIKKYNTGSALNMFHEFTMLEPKRLAPYFGFSEQEVQNLCRSQSKISFDELKEWYDGYYMEDAGAVFNPRSVTEALNEGKCYDYWNRTGGFCELEEYITKDFDGMGDTIIALMADENVSVNVLGFSNDLDSFQDRDEVITALIHMGYLTYVDGQVCIPNREIKEEFTNTVKKLSWGTVSKLLRQSRELLSATRSGNEELVARLLESVHDDMQEFKEYNNEHTLKCVIHLAYYAAQDEYELRFEAPAGKGFADCIMIPKRKGRPGIVLELKYNKSAEQALAQIRARHYDRLLRGVASEVLLVGINYDKKTKTHACKIQKYSVGSQDTRPM